MAKWCFAVHIAVIVSTLSASERTFYVAPDGCDQGPGTAEAPWATLAGARDRLRARRASGSGPEPITVWVRGGEYVQREPLMLTDQDSGTPEAPVCFRAVDGQQVVVRGGIPVTGFRPWRNAIVQARIDDAGPAAPGSRILVFDGRRMEPARFPNRDDRDVHGGAWAHVDGARISMYADSPDEDDYLATHGHLDFWQRNIPRLTRTLRLQPRHVRSWQSLHHAEVSIFPRFNWWHYVLPIESYDADQRELRLGPGSFYEIRAGDRYFVRHVLEELDCPGEWYWDQDQQTLYFWPPAPIAGRELHLSVADHLIRLEGCAHLTLRGFTFECCQRTAIVLNNCRDCTIAGNVIRNAGDYDGHGVAVEGGNRNRIVGNDIHHVGAHGVLLSGGDLHRLQRGDHQAVNNYIHHVGLVGRRAKGIEVTGAGHRVAHNYIHDVPQAGVNLWGAAHVVEYNHLRHTCLEGEDTGAISGGAIDWLGWQGVVIRHNLITDTIGFGYDEHRGQWCAPHFAWAVYPDWAASNTHIVGNILARAPRGLLHLHGGRGNVIENNLLVDGEESQVDVSGWTIQTSFWSTMVDRWKQNYDSAIQHAAWRELGTLQDPNRVPLADGSVTYDNVFRRNIVVYRNSAAALWRVRHVPLTRHFSDENLVWQGGNTPRTGQLAIREITSDNILSDPEFDDSTPGKLPLEWGSFVATGDAAAAQVVDDASCQSGRAVTIDPGLRGEQEKTVRHADLNSRAFPFEPGQAFLFEVWLRLTDGETRARLTAFSWEQATHHWQVSSDAAVNGTWQPFQLLFRLPDTGEGAFRPTMRTFHVRIGVPEGTGQLWVDRVSLRRAEVLDPWQAWLAQNQDQRSLLADPLVADPDRGDFRLRPGSPAERIGFQPLPVDKMGCVDDPLRASWPIVEWPGARERR